LDEPWTGGIGMRRLGFTTIEMIIVVVMIGIIAVIGFPKIRRALDSTNVRSTRVFVGTAVATARAAAVQRGCRAVGHFSSGAGTVLRHGLGARQPARQVGAGMKREQGFTIVEVIIAFMVLTVGLRVLVNSSALVTRMISQGQRSAVAATDAARILDSLRAVACT